MIRLFNQNIWGGFSKTEAISNRNGLILSMIQKHQPDFCTLQECHPQTSRTGADPMQDLLAYAYAEAVPEKWNMISTPVFYRKDRFEVVDSGFVPFNIEKFGISKAVSWGVFREIETGKQIGVASTHFWFKYLTEEDTLHRIENAAVVKRICDEIIAKHDVPVIVAGDMNNGSDAQKCNDRPYQAMISWGFRDVRYAAKKTTDCPTIHDYPRKNEQGIYVDADMPYYTLDYIMTYGEKDLSAESFTVLTDHDALVSSDHCPMVADFAF